jgi:hypothetical protein
VRFRWREYQSHDQQKTRALEAPEFIGRFPLHVLPAWFHRIRHYGFLDARFRVVKLIRC